MAITESTELEDVAALRRDGLGIKLAGSFLAAGIGVALLDSALPLIWAGANIAAKLYDAWLFSRITARGAPLSTSQAWQLRATALIVGAVGAWFPAMLWLWGGPVGMVVAGVTSCGSIFRNTAETARRRDLIIASNLPNVLCMLVAPWTPMTAALGGGLLAREAMLCAVVTFLLHPLFHLRRQLVTTRRMESAVALAHRSESTMRVLFDNAMLSAALLDRDLRYIAASNWLCALIRLPEQEIVGRHYLDVSPDAREVWRAAFERGLTGEATVLAEEELALEGGSIFLRMQFSPWRDEAGEIGGVCMYGQDITAFVRERSEKEAAGTRLALALHNLNAAVWEMDVPNKRVIGADQLALVLKTQPTYQDMAMLSPNTVHPDHRERLLQTIRQATRNGERYSIEHPIVSADGGVRWVHTNGEAFVDENGKLSRLVALSMNVTERKRLEVDLVDAMRRAERTLFEKRALLQAITRDIGASELPPPPAETSLPSAPAAGLEELYQRLEHLLEEIDARDRALAEAVHALREARQAAETANTSKSQFLANMSHELRTPLNAIIGYAEILEEDLAATQLDISVKDAARIRVSARHLLSLINEILDLSKIEAGKMDLQLADIDLVDLVSEAMDTVRPAATARNNKLELVVDASVRAVRADAMRVRQCLLNLLSNACKFTENGSVTICLRCTGEAGARLLQIEVIDTGIGMSESQVARLFQPFMQADASTTRKFGGTGLGLALTRRLAQLMGGDVTVSSAPNQGATFTLTLPADQARAAPDDILPAPKQHRPSSARRASILVIEDDALARDLVRRTLTPFGYNIQIAVDGAEGLALARAEKPALILLDLYLPDTSGLDLLSVLRREAPEVPVIVISSSDNRAASLALGACEHLVKPLERDQLAAAAIRFAGATTETGADMIRA